MVLLLLRRDGICRFPPRANVTVYAAQPPDGIVAGNALLGKQLDERFHVLVVRGPETSVTSPIERRAERAAPGARDGTETRLAASDDHANVPAPLAFHAHAIGRKHRLRA